MQGDAPLPPEPTAADEAMLRAAGAWPPDERGYVADPVSQEPRHWTAVAALLRRDEYDAFVAAKVALAPAVGFAPPLPLSEDLFEFQRDVARWAIERGTAALFLAFGLGKTRVQIEVGRQVCAHTGGRFLVVAPLGVRTEFRRDAEAMGQAITFIRRTDEATAPGLYLTNYESVRDGKIDPGAFDGVSLDEASILRGFGGTKTFREVMATMAGDDRRDMSARVVGRGVRYRFVATATPSPNDFIELLAYAAFLGVMDVSTAKTRFFQRNSEEADDLTLHPRKADEFWRWVASWAVFLARPSELGYDDGGYALPELRVHWHRVATDHAARRGVEKPERGQKMAQAKLFVEPAAGVTEATRERRASLPDRVAKLVEIRARNPGAHRIIWHDLEDERRAIEAAVPGVASVYGSQDLETRERVIVDFADGRVPELAAKPVMLGSGCNFQRHCAEAVFLGVDYKFNDFIQAVHRVYRFGQPRAVDVHIIYTEAQDSIRRALEEKWRQHDELVAQMTALVRQHGLARPRAAEASKDKVDVARREVRGERFAYVNNDCVREARRMDADSVDHVVTSIPFASQYKYSDSFLDFGHCDTNEHFWSQMGFLIPELLRVLKPGRVAAIHVKDRIIPGGMNGLGFQTVYPLHCDAIRHFTAHGFAYMGMVTVVTDVVRENNQTDRLTWKEFRKDSTKMGVGMPEYIILLRKPPTSRERSYADDPVTNTRESYTLGRWQVDAHAFWRSSGDRLLTPDDLAGLDHPGMFKRFAEWSRENVHDHEAHVALCDALGAAGRLPTKFMLLQPQSTDPDVWSDVARMRTLNTLQAAQDRVQHLCPMQFDVAKRLIGRFSAPGELVLDPFAGIGTVPYCAMELGRRGVGIELSPTYFDEGVRYCRAMERRLAVPTLFDLNAPGKDRHGQQG